MIVVLTWLVGCIPSPEDKTQTSLCAQVENFESFTFEQRLYPAHQPPLSCVEMAAGLAFADGYAQALDKMWRNYFFSLNRAADAQLPPISDPLVGAHARVLARCDSELSLIQSDIEDIRATVSTRVQTHLSVCNQND